VGLSNVFLNFLEIIMSASISNSVSSAIAYNQRSFKRLSLEESLPDLFLEEYKLSEGYSIEELTNAIFGFQKKVGFSLVDGKIGPQTLKKILTSYAPLDKNYWTYNIVRVPCSPDLNLECYDAPNGLDLHPVGYFSPRWFVNQKPKQIVIHWGGLNPYHLHAVFSGARKVSSHLGVGLVGNEAKAYQFMNLTHKAWHAGKSNSVSLGVDICQQPDVKWLEYYLTRHYQVRVIDNPSSRGDKQCLSLDSRIKDQLVLALYDLCVMFSIPIERPSGDGVLKDPNSFRGILGHHHISKKKWDCAPWFDEIFRALENHRPRT